MHSGTASILSRASLISFRQRRQGLGVADQSFQFFFARHAGEVVHDLLKFGRQGHIS
jgi:hypothetical protein